MISFWNQEQITQDRFRTIHRECGAPARLVEMVFWHIDTLGQLQTLDWLVMKGGTCVQSYIPSGYQRASVDLDFNSRLEHPKAIRALMEDMNEAIRTSGPFATIQDIEFGTFEFLGEDRHSGTLNYKRRLPSKFGELEKVADYVLQAKSVRVQINYRHAWLPALRTVKKAPAFFILDFEQPRQTVTIEHASREDLIADKILTTSKIGPFGRERFKDIYDLFMLCLEPFEGQYIIEKLRRISRHVHTDVRSIVRSTQETLSIFTDRGLEAKGFASMVNTPGRQRITDWEHVCMKTATVLEQICEQTDQ